ncbi:MAG TPA: DUF2911 domain-containing protein [Thermoanaerobaculia bacterium]|nr:DUF2911 domain-containing protein [Thermoanaerobaculia bacterium]
MKLEETIMKQMRAQIILLAVVLLTLSAAGQEKKKPLSPPAKAEATIAGKSITIDYSAPSRREREIMGGLVPFDKVWRTGANAATTLTTSADLMIGSLHVPAGTYTLFTIPGEKAWTLIVNKQTGQWGTNYDPSQDLGRVPMKIRSLADSVETFVIGIELGKDNKGFLNLTWENTEASAPLMVH